MRRRPSELTLLAPLYPPTGTWTYSYYANNGNLNGNDNGMGGDYTYSALDHAWFNANGAVGTALPAAANLGPVAPSYDQTSATVALTAQIESPVALYSAGIAALVFTGAKTGVAVGRFGGFADYDQACALPCAFGAASAAGNNCLPFLYRLH